MYGIISTLYKEGEEKRMDQELYKKSLEGQNLLISKNTNGITGAWMQGRTWISDVDISSMHLENYPLIMERLEIEGNLMLGFSRQEQIYWASILYNQNGVLSSEQYVTGYDVTEIVTVLNNRLIDVREYQELGR